MLTRLTGADPNNLFLFHFQYQDKYIVLYLDCGSHEGPLIKSNISGSVKIVLFISDLYYILYF